MSNFDPIGTVAFFRERQRVEAITTGKVLRAMTPEMLGYRPHPESSTLGITAWTIVRCLRVCNQLIHNPSAEVSPDPVPSHEELLLAFEETSQELSAALLVTTQNQWEGYRVVTAGSSILLEQPLGQIFWLFHADSIHHRGQISVSLRSFGAKVPSIYGPSGDFQPQAFSNLKRG